MLYGKSNIHRDFIFLSVTRREMCVQPMYASKVRRLELFHTIIFLLMNELLFKEAKMFESVRAILTDELER